MKVALVSTFTTGLVAVLLLVVVLRLGFITLPSFFCFSVSSLAAFSAACFSIVFILAPRISQALSRSIVLLLKIYYFTKYYTRR